MLLDYRMILRNIVMKTAGDLEGGRTQKDRMNPNGARLGTHVDSSSCRVSDWYRAESRPPGVHAAKPGSRLERACPNRGSQTRKGLRLSLVEQLNAAENRPQQRRNGIGLVPPPADYAAEHEIIQSVHGRIKRFTQRNKWNSPIPRGIKRQIANLWLWGI